MGEEALEDLELDKGNVGEDVGGGGEEVRPHVQQAGRHPLVHPLTGLTRARARGHRPRLSLATLRLRLGLAVITMFESALALGGPRPPDGAHEAAEEVTLGALQEGCVGGGEVAAVLHRRGGRVEDGGRVAHLHPHPGQGVPALVQEGG